MAPGAALVINSHSQRPPPENNCCSTQTRSLPTWGWRSRTCLFCKRNSAGAPRPRDRVWCGDGICQLHSWQLYPALPGRSKPLKEKRLRCTFGNQCGPFLFPLPVHPYPTLGTSEMYQTRRDMRLVLLRYCTLTAGAIHSGLASRSHIASSPDSSNPKTLSVGPISVSIRAGPQILDFA